LGGAFFHYASITLNSFTFDVCKEMNVIIIDNILKSGASLLLTHPFAQVIFLISTPTNDDIFRQNQTP
jgi:hypothetical protein